MLKEKTRKQQSLLANYCRTNVLPDTLEVRKDRVHHYRRLVFNIILDMMDTMYPISKRLFSEDDWEQLIHRFFENYKCTDPQVWKMPRFLIDYTRENEKGILRKFPFLTDLLLIEWKELEWFTNEDLQPVELKNDFNFRYHPEHEIIVLDYPVFRKEGVDYWINNPGKYFLLIYRHPDNRKVYYNELDAFTSFTWESIKEGKKNDFILSELRQFIEATNQKISPEILLNNTIHLFKSLKLIL
jgi:hypothetical protein